jgi:hypothetical protein
MRILKIKIKIKISIISCLFLMLFYTYSLNAQTALPKTSGGWTMFQPSKNSLIVYVSSSDGNDDTGVAYTITSIGSDPFVPEADFNLKPFQTFKAAFEKTRDNQADWILVKRGDNLFESISVRDGKSPTEPFLITTYGESDANPIFNTGDKAALQMCCKSFNFIAVQGLDFYAHTRDPNSPFYVSPKGSKGLGVYISEKHVGNSLLIEGNRFKFYTNNVVQGPGILKNIMIRRNSFFDNYSTTSHSQGLYVANVSLSLEENIFDHNGWLVQAAKNIGKQQGAATMYNHNTYFSGINNVEIVNNIFIRSSSIHNKFTANHGKHSSSNVLIKNNLYLDGEIGISAGGNTKGAFRFKNFKVSDNVMLNIGRSQPTGRTLGWGIDIQDWDGGVVKNNYFLNQVSKKVDNTFGIRISGTSQKIIIQKNIFNNLFNANALVLAGNGLKKNININNNQFSFTKNSGNIINVEVDLSGYVFKNNKYFHDAGQNKTYVTNNQSRSFWSNLFFTFNDENFKNWILLSSEYSNQWSKPRIKEQRTIESYLKSIDKEESIDNLINEIRSMSYKNWKHQFTANQINKYIKLGYSSSERTDE